MGRGLTEAAPGSVQNLFLVVPDVEAARAQLTAAGVEASPVVDLAWGSFTYFADPDGNGWAVQQLPATTA